MNMRKKTILGSFAFLIILVTTFAGFSFWNDFKNNQKEIAASFVPPKGAGRGVEEEAYPSEMKNEKYRLPQVAFGGGLTSFFPGLGEPLGPLDISDVRSEILKTKDKKGIKLVVNWETRRPTKCSVEYAKGEGQGKSIAEDYFSVSHSAIFSDLESASTYNYIITAKDKLGGEAMSDKFAVYTGAPEICILDLLAGAFKDVFGWAVR